MAPTNHPGHVIPQDVVPGDASEAFGVAEPYTQIEIEDLLYGNDRPASQRLARLRELRDEATVRESGDWGGQDPAATLEELDRAIDELSAMIANSDDNDEYATLAPTFDKDPGDRLDALSPDDVDARHAIESDDEEEDGIEPLDEAEWDEGDGFKPERGVQ
ncbi:MAG TPA: hypothetical protein VGN60_12135 [Devosia sp.]|jgi:hypothetical protein|nr:hypothetical protein [Devosia sp.]